MPDWLGGLGERLQGGPPPPSSGLGDRLQAELERRAAIRRSYATALSPMEELKFRDWKQRFAPQDSGEDYDLRGAFRAGFQPDPETGHWPDVYKKPNHPTFSDQSIYAGDRPELAGSWDGDTYLPPQGAAEQSGGLGDRLQTDVDTRPYLERNYLLARILAAPSKLFGGLVVDPIIDAATLAGDVVSGKQPTMAFDPQTGETGTNPQVAGRALNAASVLAGGGVATAAGREGTLGIFGGPLAKGADLEALSVAKKMKAEGADRDTIWKETGWDLQHPDKIERFEIDDSASRIGTAAMDDLTFRGLGGHTERPVAGVLNHPALYEAYPELRNIGAGVDYNVAHPGSSGYYDKGGISEINPRIGVKVNAIAGPEGPRSLMLHELQHPVQRIEGFARGGSPDEYAYGPMFDRKAIDLQGDLSQELTGGLSHKPPEIIRDIQFADPARVEAIARKHGFVSSDEALAFLKQQDEKRTPFGQYRRLAGEVEARNVQQRRNMTAEERRATPPWKTQDVPDEQQIVRFKGLGDRLQVNQ